MLGSRIAEIKATILLLAKAIEENTVVQRSNGEKLTELIRKVERLSHANENFVGVIENFFAIRKKLDIEEAKRRELRELENQPTKYDSMY